MKKTPLLLFIILLVNMVLAQGAFNVEIDLPETYQSVLTGENIWFTTKLVNLENQERVDVRLQYEILDRNRQLKASKTETVAVETQASFVGNIKIPDMEKGLYFLKVTLDSSFGKSEAEISFNVIKERTEAWIVIELSLFDIQVTIPDNYKIIYPGEELLTSIKLVNLGSAGRVDVFLDYWITDSEQNIIIESKETVAVETQANFVRTFDIPINVKPGKYRFYVKLTYADGKEAISEHSFEVMKKQIDQKIYYVLLGLIILALLVYLISKSKPIVRKLQMRAKVSKIVKARLRD